MVLVKPVLYKTSDPFSSALSAAMGKENKFYHHEIDGYVIGPHWNPEFFIKGLKNSGFCDLFDIDDDYTIPFPPIGVVDSVEQFDDLFGEKLRAFPQNVIVSFVEIRREDQPPSGGWRYHKWGEYFGTQNPEYEHIYDDKHIEKVYTFAVYPID